MRASSEAGWPPPEDVAEPGYPHCPIEHDCPGGQPKRQLPQWFGSLLRSTSQPSAAVSLQLPKPGSHTFRWHVEGLPVQATEACGTGQQTDVAMSHGTPVPVGTQPDGTVVVVVDVVTVGAHPVDVHASQQLV